MSPECGSPETRFVADRMLGTLTRYLRFMGYDTLSANGFSPGNAQEDNLLLALAQDEHRILLTRDHELARRGNDRAVLVTEGDVLVQVQQLIDLGLIERRLLMSRCSLCNTVLREAGEDEIRFCRVCTPGQEWVCLPLVRPVQKTVLERLAWTASL